MPVRQRRQVCVGRREPARARLLHAVTPARPLRTASGHWIDGEHAIAIVAKGSRELAEPHQCSPSKGIVPRSRPWAATHANPARRRPQRALFGAPRHSEWAAGPRQLEAQGSAHVGHRGSSCGSARGFFPSRAPFPADGTNANDLQTDTFARRIPLSAGVSRRHVRRACEPTHPRSVICSGPSLVKLPTHSECRGAPSC